MGPRFTALLIACLVAWAPAALAAPGAPSGWDGTNPFDCTLQYAGMGTEFPDPGADPFCVEYDKTHQNISELGLIDFLSKEPARVAAAGEKCFYFQHDHWTGYVVQADGSTETYNWDGSYFYDRATANGGVYVENFTINNQTQDPRELPGFPAAWKPYFGPGKGGFQTSGSVPADPDCIEKAAKDPPERGAPPDRCRDWRGAVDRGLGPLRLGMTRKQAEDALGPPARETRGFKRWCHADGGKFMAAFGRGGRADFALTGSRGFEYRGRGVGDRPRGLRRVARRGSTSLYARRHRGWTALAGVERGRIVYLAAADDALDLGELGRRLSASR